MKLASLRNGRDGELVVVSGDLARAVRVPDIACTLQAALDDWARVGDELHDVAAELNANRLSDAFPFDPRVCASPLPRAYQWADGSAYVNHVELVRRARGAQMPASFWHDPLMYQGGSDGFLGPSEDIPLRDAAWGLDFEGEIAVITDDVAMGADESAAAVAVRLLMLVNDVSLRGLIPGELDKGFGFFQSKPATAFSPVAVTPDELGTAWRDGRVHLPLLCTYNDQPFGKANAGVDMTFSFPRLIAHAARTRSLGAGSIVGSGTVSNKQGTEHGSAIADGGVGYSCLAELRMIETIRDGQPATPFMRAGDRIRIEMRDAAGHSIFGAIDQRVVDAG
ncbi:MAG: fumarylacetoacetate hydrolase family protein [Pseudomonadales bacterium]|nr:fumarylacetoacetate hydrolase family protein [Pseudomonadales bacterium]MCP5183577.1 fumarylacetoacetate hydrolase family protein [Pseudomonadales bacterium]